MKKRKKQAMLSVVTMVGPVVMWIVLLILIPMAYVAFMSFMQRGRFGGIRLQFSLEAYESFFDPLYLQVILKSVGISVKTTIMCILVGYPFAYYIAKRPAKKAALIILLVMAPFWTSGLVKTYSWVLLMNTTGIINNFLTGVGLIDKPIQLLYNDWAVTLGLLYGFLPYAVLPMYSSIEKLDKSLLEASNDLGARPVKTFLKITLPLTAPGIFASVILVFIPSLGAYFTADVLGGGTSLVIGNLIKNQFTVSKNWPFGSAISIILVMGTLLLLYLYSRVGDLDELV